MYNNYLDVFYNCLIKEASRGSVDCFFKYNMMFNTRIIEDNIEVFGEVTNSELLVPTLVIKNKEYFNYLLKRYVDVSLNFYDDSVFPEEIRDSKYFDNELGVSKEKMIMTLLWSNATIEDFNDPCAFLMKRIAFFELGEFDEYLEESIISYSSILDANIGIVVLKNGLESETPYSLKISLFDTITDRRIYEFPRVYFGVFENAGYVYAIQNSKKRFVDETLVKKIDRILYKVNEGIDVGGDNYDNYGVGNLKDITPNSLVSANILMGLFRKNGISKICIPSILVSRWNAKMIVLDNLVKRKKKSVQEVLDDYDNYVYLQSNLTEKFLRVFRRIGYHHSSVMVSSYPYVLSSGLELEILDGVDVCNNKLLDETMNFDECKYKGIIK